jgi:general L-amino acid transport system permease protein
MNILRADAAPAVVSRRLAWSDPRTRAIVWQMTAVGIVCATIALAAIQTAANLKLRGIVSGFDYLSRATGFEIAPGLLAFSSRDTFARALKVGLLNTLRVSLLGILIATALGLLIGVARLSNIWIVSTMSRVYVEVLRNTPLLLQLLLWYSLSQALPGPRDALNFLPGVFMWHGSYFWLGAALLTLAVLIPAILARSRRRRQRTGRGLPTIRLLAGAAVVLLSAAIVIDHPVVTVERPALL